MALAGSDGPRVSLDASGGIGCRGDRAFRRRRRRRAGPRDVSARPGPRGRRPPGLAADASGGSSRLLPIPEHGLGGRGLPGVPRRPSGVAHGDPPRRCAPRAVRAHGERLRPRRLRRRRPRSLRDRPRALPGLDRPRRPPPWLGGRARAALRPVPRRLLALPRGPGLPVPAARRGGAAPRPAAEDAGGVPGLGRVAHAGSLARAAGERRPVAAAHRGLRAGAAAGDPGRLLRDEARRLAAHRSGKRPGPEGPRADRGALSCPRRRRPARGQAAEPAPGRALRAGAHLRRGLPSDRGGRADRPPAAQHPARRAAPRRPGPRRARLVGPFMGRDLRGAGRDRPRIAWTSSPRSPTTRGRSSAPPTCGTRSRCSRRSSGAPSSPP